MTVKYSDHYVAYLDILGFKKRVDDAEKIHIGVPVDEGALSAEQFINMVNQTWNAIFAPINDTGIGDRVFTKMFSDCLSIATPQDADGLFRILQIVAHMQYRLLIEGLFLRGGLSKGGHFENESVIFSKGLVDAYELEQKAFYPRVLIDGLVVRQIKAIASDSKDNPISAYVMCAPDGLAFVDYLNIAKSVSPNCSEYRQCLMYHKQQVLDQILEQLNADIPDPNIVKKYRWLADYHNEKCNQFLKKNSDSGIGRNLLIDHTELPRFNEINNP